MKAKNIAVAAAVVATLVTTSYAQTLDQVVDRMSDYLLFYEQQLREVVADERYTQREYIRDATGFKQPSRTRTLQSEVAFMRLPNSKYWYGVRDTKAVDGKALGTNGLHIADLERKRNDLDAHIGEFKEVEKQVTAELKQRGADPESD